MAFLSDVFEPEIFLVILDDIKLESGNCRDISMQRRTLLHVLPVKAPILAIASSFPGVTAMHTISDIIYPSALSSVNERQSKSEIVICRQPQVLSEGI